MNSGKNTLSGSTLLEQAILFQMTTIQFYRENDPYGCFSNFSKHPVVIDGITWKTTEHYFQAMKFQGTPHEQKIRNASSPTEAKRLGGTRSVRLRSDWEDVKDDVMYKALQAKFTQHPNIQATLLGTGTATLVEHTSRDSYWGDGGDGSGKNKLGLLLMKLRDELK